MVKELDVVRLKDGRAATILEVFEDGAAYLVEIADEKGEALDMPFVGSDDIEKALWEF